MINFGYLVLHRVYAYVINLLIVTLGCIAYSQLNYAEDPKEIDAVITVQAHLGESPPKTMEETVTNRIENAVSGTTKLKFFRSRTTSGNAVVICRFSTTDLGEALSQLRDKLSADNRMPREMRPPTITRGDITNNMLVIDACIYDTNTSQYKTNYEYMNALRKIALRIQSEVRSVEGVADCNTDDTPPSITLLTDPAKMKLLNVSMSSVYHVLNNRGVHSAGKILIGSIEKDIALDLSMPLADQDILELYVPTLDGDRYVQLKEFAQIHRTALSNKTRFEFNGHQVMYVGVKAKEDGNPMEISKQVRAIFKKYEESTPFTIAEMQDHGSILEEELHGLRDEVLRTILITLCIVGLVLGVRASLVAITTIPISIFGACIAMRCCGLTLNSFTLLALILAIGLVVDDAIIVAENIEWYINKYGLSPLKAALRSIGEIQTAIIGMTLTLAAVFVPYYITIATPADRAFIITLLAAVIISGVVALTLSPVMCVQLLRPHAESGIPQSGYKYIDQAVSYCSSLASRLNTVLFEQSSHKYRYLLSHLLEYDARRYICFVLVPILSIITAAVYNYLPRMEIGEESTYISVSIRTPNGSGLDYHQRYLNDIQALSKDQCPEKTYLYSSVDLTRSSVVVVGLPRPRKRKTSFKAKDLEKKILKQVELSVPGIQVNAFGDKQGSQSEMLDIIIYGELSEKDINRIKYQSCHALLETGAFQQMPDLYTQYQSELRYLIKPIPHMLCKYRVSQDSLIQTIKNSSKTGHVLGYVNLDGQMLEMTGDVMPIEYNPHRIARPYITQIPISRVMSPHVSELPRSSHTSFVESMCVEGVHPETKQRILVPLAELANVDSVYEPHELHKHKGQRCIRIRGMVRTEVGLQKAYNASKAALKPSLPHGVMVDTDTDIEDRGVFSAGIAVFVVVILFLAAVYENFIDPFIILPTILTALLGGCVGLLAYGGFLTRTIVLAAFLLMGLILKHGILLVSVSNDYLRAGSTIKSAALQGAHARFRPILITTIAMTLGMIMLLFDNGTQAIMRQQLAIFVISGLTLGTFLTMFIIPCVYVVVKTWARRRFGEDESAPV
jgi:multidrug efflux pump